jgi:two-component system, NarL family, sensor kinase
VPGVDRFVEVTLPLDIPGRPTYAMEVYYDFARVDHQIGVLQARIVPVAVLALLALQLVQVPIAGGLSRLVRRHVEERAALLERALSASDAERRAVAADLHDGAVQDLSGAVFALTALRSSIAPAMLPVAQRTIDTLSHAGTSLRRLIVDIYPPDLTVAGLPSAVDELAEPLRRNGVSVVVDVADLPPMDRDTAAAVYRVARETLANVAKHACADNVYVRLAPDPGGGIRLEVTDDGIGMAPDALSASGCSATGRPTWEAR